MYAVVNLAGKQFTVRPDENIRVPLLDVEVGSVIQCDDVLLYSDGDDVRVGQPKVEGVKVTADAGPTADWNLANFFETGSDLADETLRDLIPSLSYAFGYAENVGGNRLFDINDLIQTISATPLGQEDFSWLKDAADFLLSDMGVKNVHKLPGSKGNDELSGSFLDTTIIGNGGSDVDLL